MNKIIKHLAGVLMFAPILFTASQASAQNGRGSDVLSKLAVSSPTTAGIAKFTDFPVGAYSGTPDISIPLYTIATGFVNMPITLSYHSGGFKVNENAGSSGLGWSILAGGVINRSVLGLEDDGSWTTNGLNWISQPIDLHNDTVYQQMNMLAQNGIDGVPDLYTYNMNGYGGKFIFADKIRQLPQSNVQINRINNDEYHIITPDGVKYVFAEPERSLNKSSGSASDYTVAWYLTKIIAADRSDSIMFTYMRTGYEMETGRSFSVDLLQNSAGFYYGANSFQASYINRISGKQLSRIDFRQGSVEFDLTWNTRQDLSGVDSAALVNRIIVKNRQGTILKSIGFKYDYFTNASNTSDNKRLRLIGAYFYPGASTDTLQAERYNFIYNPMQLPSKSSLALDHWGYYNGASNSTLVPSWSNCVDDFSPPSCTYCEQSPYSFKYNGADRESNPLYCKMGMLERINLPTGGYRLYEWEPNDYVNPDAGKPIYSGLQTALIGVVESTGSSFVEDSSADFYVDPAAFPNGICGKLIGNMTAGSEDPAEITHSGSSLKLYKRAGRTVVEGFSLSGDAGPSQTAEVMLSAGQTYFMVCRTRGSGFTVSGNLQTSVITGYQPRNKTAGGCRLKQVTLHDQITNTDLISKYTYRLPDDTAVSSGNAGNRPIYEAPLRTFIEKSLCVYDEKSGVRLSANSVYNIGAGSIIGYTYVKESHGPDNANGYTLYQFTNDFEETSAGEFDATWRRGQLISKTDYSGSGAARMKTYNNVFYDNRGFTHFQGRQVVSYSAHPCASTTTYSDVKPVYFTFKLYYFPTDWLYVDSTCTTQFDIEDPLRFSNSYTRSFYDNPEHKMATRVYTRNSKDYEVRSITKYTTDYTLPAGTLTGEQLALKDMQQKNRLEIVEQYQQIINPAAPSTIYTTGGLYNVFTTAADVTGSNAVIGQQYKLEAGSGSISFMPSNVNGTTMKRDDRYVLNFKINKYDSSYNFAEVEKDYLSSAYIWDYNRSHLTAVVKGASQGDIAATSFEAEGKGNWTFSGTPIDDGTAVTGRKSYVLNGAPLSRSGLVSSNVYTLSYWSKNSSAYSVSGTVQGYPIKGRSYNGWTYFEHKITGVTAVSISGNGSIDEVRLYPAEASAVTYTYDPLVGVTSECGPEGAIVYYIYDGLGRLIMVRDQDGKILKQIDYQYQASVNQ